MNADAVKATLHELARATLHTSGDLPDGELAEHLDSVQLLALVVAIEDHWEIAFDPEDEDQVRTVDDVVRVILDKLEDRGDAG